MNAALLPTKIAARRDMAAQANVRALVERAVLEYAARVGVTERCPGGR